MGWYYLCTHITVRSLSFFLFVFFSISVTNRNDLPNPHLWRAEGRDPVPRWRVQNKSSASGHESHLVFRKDFHAIDSACDHVNIPVPVEPASRFSLFLMELLLIFGFFYWFLLAPQCTGGADFRGLLVFQLDLYNCYVLCRLTSCTLNSLMWSRSIPLQWSGHQIVNVTFIAVTCGLTSCSGWIPPW